MVVINISDQHTRLVQKDKNARVYGVLVGIQSGKRVDIYNSFDIVLEEKSQIDQLFILQKGRQFYRVFTGMEILGWYVSGNTSAPIEGDLAIHSQIERLQEMEQVKTFDDNTKISFSESPLLLCLNTYPKENQRDLPMKLYENTLTMVNGKPSPSFTSVNFIVATSEIERIGVDHVANVNRAGSSLLQGHLSTMLSSIRMLNSRITILKKYMQAVKAGELKPSPSIIRDIQNVTHQLPAIKSNEFKVEFLAEYNDALLITYMASITKSSIAVLEMLDKFNGTYDRHSRHTRGMGF